MPEVLPEDATSLRSKLGARHILHRYSEMKPYQCEHFWFKLFVSAKVFVWNLIINYVTKDKVYLHMSYCLITIVASGKIPFDKG